MVGPELVPILWKQAVDEAGNHLTSELVQTVVFKALGRNLTEGGRTGASSLSTLEQTLLEITHVMIRSIKMHDLDNVLMTIERIRLNIESSRIHPEYLDAS
jgi:hypothetical protein